jgi:hypothetical protein
MLQLCLVGQKLHYNVLRLGMKSDGVVERWIQLNEEGTSYNGFAKIRHGTSGGPGPVSGGPAYRVGFRS